ncbi:MAG TPA: TIGR04076 family protein [Candidatus Omnitrophota bacterium]|nr:TIGR04076 family protein [Candidatus Omnitrophota bacterium]HPD85523.1 TIGR04076 family protein [Candidatus Omnitrophota bacterium]HRZ04437.1 TIGR04076 family protein [Candidatus Omnitrophota bacterium]
MAPGIFPKLRLTIVENSGYCYHDYFVGQQFILDDFTHAPKHFCLGIAQNVFPTLYALTFGAQFNDLENASSAIVTCPDHAKMKFLVELLNADGNVVVTKKNQADKNKKPKLRASIYEVMGKGCTCGYKLGQTFEIDGLKTPANFCATAYAMMFPAVYALYHGANYKHMNPQNQINTLTCPMGGNRFKLERLEGVLGAQKNKKAVGAKSKISKAKKLKRRK